MTGEMHLTSIYKVNGKFIQSLCDDYAMSPYTWHLDITLN